MSDDQPLAITDLHLRTLLDASPVGMLVFNDREEIILANPPAERLFGLRTQPPSAERCGDVIRCANRLTAEKGCGHTDACPRCPLFRGLRSTITGTATPADQEGETSLDREPGCAPLWIRYKIRPLVINGKRGALLTIDDITALRQTEQRYTMLFREMLNAFALHEILCDNQGRPVNYRFLAVNPAFERMTGLSAEQVVGRTVLEVLPGIDPFWIETYGRVALTGEPACFQNYSREIAKYFSISAFCPSPGQFACLFEDISQQKILIEQSRDGIVILDHRGKVREANQRFADMLGYTQEEIQRLHVWDWDTQWTREQLLEAIAHLDVTGDFFETTHRRKDGITFPVEISTNGSMWTGKKLVFCICRDITERKQAEEALKESERNYRQLIETASDAVYLLDAEGRVLRTNSAAARMLGRSINEITGLTIDQIDPNFSFKDFLSFWQTSPENVNQLFESTHLHKDGHSIPIEISGAKFREGNTTHYYGIARDITERKEMEEERSRLQAQLVHAQKMEAIGTLAGGIAHDFNNILGAVIGYAEMAREDSPSGSAIARDIDRVLEAGNRAASLVKQILAFSRQQKIERIALDPGLIVEEVVKFLRPSLPSTIAIHHHVANKRSVLADPSQLHQVLLNLATNAYQAMEQTGGSLEIRVEDVDYNQADLAFHPGITPGPFVRLIVADSGPGIPAAIRDRIFEPFFTTKAIGRGTGMGLAIVDGIVRGSSGFITCESEPGKGTVFAIALPAHVGETTNTDKEGEVTVTGHGRILFVDDEEMLTEMGQTMLERIGYEVTVRTSSLEALTTFQNDPHRFDAVITDQTMPDMTGLDLARRMLQIRPELPIILCTGYSNLVDEAQAKAYGIKGFAMKPLTKREVVALLKSVLAEAESPTKETPVKVSPTRTDAEVP